MEPTALGPWTSPQGGHCCPPGPAPPQVAETMTPRSSTLTLGEGWDHRTQTPAGLGSRSPVAALVLMSCSEFWDVLDTRS